MHVSIHHRFTDNVNQQECNVSGSLVIAMNIREQDQDGVCDLAREALCSVLCAVGEG